MIKPDQMIKVKGIQISEDEKLALIVTEEEITEQWDDKSFLKKIAVLTIAEKNGEIWEICGINSSVLNGSGVEYEHLTEHLFIQITPSKEIAGNLSILIMHSDFEQEDENPYSYIIVLEKDITTNWYVKEATFFGVPLGKMQMTAKSLVEDKVLVFVEESFMPYPPSIEFQMGFEEFDGEKAYVTLYNLGDPTGNG